MVMLKNFYKNIDISNASLHGAFTNINNKKDINLDNKLFFYIGHYL